MAQGQHCGRAASDTLSRSLGDPVQSGVEAVDPIVAVSTFPSDWLNRIVYLPKSR